MKRARDAPPKRFYTTRELAEAWSCSRQYIDKLRQKEELHAFRVGKNYVFPLWEIDRYAKLHME